MASKQTGFNQKLVSTMDLAKSIFSLTKRRNGLFVSQKQADWLRDQLMANGGWVCTVSSGYWSCPVFAEWDEAGITKLVKSRKSGDELIFERKEAGKLTQLEQREFAKLMRRKKSIERDVAVWQDDWDSGAYIASVKARFRDTGYCTIDEYVASFCEIYDRHQDGRRREIAAIDSRICEITQTCLSIDVDRETECAQ